MADKPRGEEFIVAGNLTVKLVKTCSRGRDKDIMAAVTMAGLEDMAGQHFFLLHVLIISTVRFPATINSAPLGLSAIAALTSLMMVLSPGSS